MCGSNEAISSHRGQEFLKVAPIGYNSVLYMQREIDIVLREVTSTLLGVDVLSDLLPLCYHR